MRKSTNGWVMLFCLQLSTLAMAQSSEIKELRFEPVDSERERTVPVKVYLPESQNALPVVLFSHGLGGSRENNTYLGNYWAEAGYVAVFMQHPGSDEDVWKNVKPRERLTALKSAATTTASVARFLDVPFVIDQLEAWNTEEGHALQGKLDLEHLGMSGHSYGCVTTLALAGQKFPVNVSFADDRIGAFLAMSPQPGKRLGADRAFGHVKHPILCMTGTADTSPINPKLTPANRREVYAALPAPDKYQLVLDGAGHFAFGDSQIQARRRNPKHHAAIERISRAFWDAYLKNDIQARKWLQSDSPLKKTGLGDQDVWQWK